MSAVEVWNSERIFHSGTEFFDVLEKELAAAEKSVDLETYIYEDDPLGRKIAKLLSDAAKRGATVRVMVDGVGSPGFFSRFGDELLHAGVHVRIFNPSPLDLSLISYRLFPGVSQLIQFFASANRRNHRKSFIIDHRCVYTGGINVSAKQSARYSGEKTWRDTGIRVEGREIAEFQKAFEVAWQHAWSPVKQKKTLTFYWQRYRRRKGAKGNPLVLLNFTRSLRRRANWELINKIERARDRIWITTAYFIPEASIMRAMRDAARNGIDVRIIVPCKSDIFFTPWVGSAFYHTLLKAGVKIFEYLPCMIHAKTIVIDSWATVGSANINHRSVFHDLEASVVVTTEEGIRSLENQFGVDQALSRRVTEEDWQNRPIVVRLIGSILLFWKHWF